MRLFVFYKYMSCVWPGRVNLSWCVCVWPASLSKTQSGAQTLLVVSSEGLQTWCKPCHRATRNSLHHHRAVPRWLVSLPKQNQTSHKLNRKPFEFRNVFNKSKVKTNYSMLIKTKNLELKGRDWYRGMGATIKQLWQLYFWQVFPPNYLAQINIGWLYPCQTAAEFTSRLLEPSRGSRPRSLCSLRRYTMSTKWTESEQKSVSPVFPFLHSGSRLGDLCVAEESKGWNEMLNKENASLFFHPGILGFYTSVWSCQRLSGIEGS